MTGVNKNRIRLPYPHPGQMRVRKEACRFNWLSAGRRWRKTTTGMSIIVEAAALGGVYFWGAPTFSQVRIGWNEAKQACGGLATFTQGRMEASFPGGGTIIYRSLDDPDNARGFTVDGAIIDEVGSVKASAWYEVLRPTLIDTNGWFWGIGTPNGRNWFWREHRASSGRDDSMSWQIPTMGVKVIEGQLVRVPHRYENPDIPFPEIENLFNTLAMSVFRQEILAEFIEGEGIVFRNIRPCVGVPPIHPDPNLRYVMGVDWAQQKDFTVLTVMEEHSRRVCEIDRFNQIGWDVQRGRLTALAERWNVSNILAEENSIGGPNIEQLQSEGLPVRGFTTTNQSKQEIIVALQLGFEREQISIPDNDLLIGELESFEAERLPSGRWRYAAAEGLHDDMVISLALAYEAANRPLTIKRVQTNLYGSRGRAGREKRNGTRRK